MKIFNGAVSTSKLREDAVTGPKIKNRAVGGQNIARAVPGIALAGAFVGDDGVIFNWFNRLGGQPTVTKTGTGTYDITFPGLQGFDAIGTATKWGAGAGMITYSDILDGGADPHLQRLGSADRLHLLRDDHGAGCAQLSATTADQASPRHPPLATGDPVARSAA